MDQQTTAEELHRLAIAAALNCQWEEAVRLNQQLVDTPPVDITTLNRLARALCELGRYKDAKKIYQEVLELDPYNSIAQKNLKKISASKDDESLNHGGNGATNRVFSAAVFLQEPGITKIVNLTKIAEPQKLLMLSAGTIVNLVPKTKTITVVDGDNHYIGVLPDDTSYHLMRLIKGGNKYQAIVKSVKPNSVTVLLRETYRSKRFHNQPSFIDEAGSIVSMASDSLFIGEDSDSSHEEETEETNV